MCCCLMVLYCSILTVLHPSLYKKGVTGFRSVLWTYESGLISVHDPHHRKLNLMNCTRWNKSWKPVNKKKNSASTLLYGADSLKRLLPLTLYESRAEQEEIRGDVGGCFMLFIDAENSSKLRALNELEKKIQVSFQLLANSASQHT